MTDDLPQWITMQAWAGSGTLPSSRQETSRVIWFHIQAEHAATKSLVAALQHRCTGLTAQHATKLLSRDEPPTEPHERSVVTAFSVRSIDPKPDDSRNGLLGSFVFQRIAMLSGPDWLMTCEHPATANPTSEVSSSPPAAPAMRFDELQMLIRGPWTQQSSKTPANLGLLVLRALVDSHTAARRKLRQWLEAWETDLYNRLSPRPSGAGRQPPRSSHAIGANDLLPLMELRAQRNLLFAALEPLNRPGMKTNHSLIWFRGGDPMLAERVDEPLDRCLRNLRDFREVLRSAIDLVATFVAAEQSRQSERFQELATFIAAVLLVPTLVAAIYGANVSLPGKDHAAGLLIMFVAMAITAVVTGLGLRYWQRRRNHESRMLVGR